MDDNTNDNGLDASLTQWAHGVLAQSHTPEQIREIATPTPREPSTAAVVYRPLTNDELREKRCEIVRESLDRHHPGPDCTEEDVKRMWL
jgi:hypothetical protein